MPLLNVCCCGCSLKLGTILIAVYYLVMSIESATVVIIMSKWKNIPEQTSQNATIPQELVTFVSDHHTELCLSSALNVFQALWALCLLFGALMEDAILLLVWVIAEFLLTIATNIIDIMIVISLTMTLNEMLSHPFETYVIVFSIISPVIFGLFLTVYLLLVVFSYYQTVRENRRPSTVSESQTQTDE